MRYWWIIIPILLIFYVIWSEPASQNALNRQCHNSTPPSIPTDTIKETVDKTIETVRKNHNLVGWRRSILVGIILSLPIIYLVGGRFPTGFIFFAISGLIAVGSYFATTWFEYSWWLTRDTLIEKGLLQLRSSKGLKDKITKKERQI